MKYADFCSDSYNCYCVIQVKSNLKVEVDQLELSDMQLSSNFENLKAKYYILIQEIEKSTYINEAETIIGQLEEALSEIESNLMEIRTKTQTNFKLSFMKKHKVSSTYVFTLLHIIDNHYMYIHMYIHIYMYTYMYIRIQE